MSDSHQHDVELIGRIEAVPRILDVVCRTTGMGFAAVARVTDDRWIACQVLDRMAFGLLPGSELRLETTICNEICGTREPVAIDHVAEDPAFRGHHTPAQYGFQSYISVPILLQGGRFFGTLCAIDPRPLRVNTPETLGMFRLFAELIGTHISSEEALRDAQAELTSHRAMAGLREEFIAILGHDLRNPVASIASGVRLLGRSVTDEGGRSILALMQGSVLRMTGLIGNLMDFARARLGEGLSIEASTAQSVRPAVEQAVAELRSVHPNREIHTDLDLDLPVVADHARLSQLLSNLLSNAIAHGAPEGPVRVGGTVRDGQLALWVANAGRPIPPEVRAALFRPFSRGTPGRTGLASQGLGLGLYIAGQIAKAHGGRIEVASDESETRFTLQMPAG
ncbi:GAF domain-containing sensor histidine kinase [Pararoseomonas indoligenes]|uniref:histidine kinase n=1 Tax=Roseomonas indoligenes TaxID=2820811 RepID=A0A940S5U3_9PROT|nr:GAF domain-containing sensor histidine kinase [Pararoseomonas indoligenes]MBP0493364.1 GAF domain-containing sensor histidine kinase [Pararoseomonas indoligenes]